MDALASLLSRKTRAETTVVDGVENTEPSEPIKLPGPIGMVAKMLGVSHNDMMQALHMMAGAATAMQDTTKRLETMQAQQTAMAHALVAMAQHIAVLEQRSRPIITPHSAGDTTESDNE